MKVVFMGYQPWGNVTLRALLEAGHDVPLVVTHPPGDHPYESIWPDAVAEIAAEMGIQCIESSHAGEDVGTAIAAARPQVIFASNWRTWLSPAVFGLASEAAFNIHDGLLPRYGGLAPLNWAVANGESEAGVTVHHLASEIDLGDIAVQASVPIGPSDTATDLLHCTLPLFADLALQTLDELEAGTLRRQPQDPREATFFHKRSERDSLIDWSAPPQTVHNLVRAQSDPYPNAFTQHEGRRLRVKRTTMPERVYCGTPGRVFCREGDGVVVVCGKGQTANQGLVVDEVEPEDGPAMAAAAFFETTGFQLGAEVFSGTFN